MSIKKQTKPILYSIALVVILCILGVGGWLAYGLRTGEHLPGSWPAKWYFNTEYGIPWDSIEVDSVQYYKGTYKYFATFELHLTDTIVKRENMQFYVDGNKKIGKAPWVYWEFEELEDIIKAHSKTNKGFTQK